MLAAIDELGFVRNEAARRLRGAGSRTLAYVVLDAANPFFTDVARGVQDAADTAGLVVYLCDSGQGTDRQNAYLDLLEQQRVLGVLITPVDPHDPRISTLGGRGMPVVLVDRVAGPGLCSVSVDDVLGGELAVTHLLDSGHRRIAFVGGPRRIGQVADRITGAEQAIAAAGTGELLVHGDRDAEHRRGPPGRRTAGRAAGVRDARPPRSAATTWSRSGCCSRWRSSGSRVPADLAIVGYDDVEFAQAAAVPLTSVSQPRQLLGRTAAELLLAEAGGDPDHEHRQVVFSPELVVRASTLLPGRNSVSGVSFCRPRRSFMRCKPVIPTGGHPRVRSIRCPPTPLSSTPPTSTGRPPSTRTRWPSTASSARPRPGDPGRRRALPDRTATTLRVQGGKGGDVVTTDGPYAETKEVLTGFYLLECADLDEAIATAAAIPAAWHGAVEVRPIIPMQD